MVRQISVPWWMQGVGAVIPFRFRAENIASVAPIKTASSHHNDASRRSPHNIRIVFHIAYGIGKF